MTVTSSKENTASPAQSDKTVETASKSVAITDQQPAQPVELGSNDVAKRISRADAKLLSRAIQLEETDPPFALSGTVRLIGALVLAFVLWASITPFAEKAIATGYILPFQRVQVVQPVEGGRVSEILVQDGETVTQGQVLIVLDRSALVADWERAQAARAGAALEAARLVALLEDRPAELTGLADAFPDLREAAQAAARTDSENRAAAIAVQTAQLNASRQTVQGLRGEITALEDQVASLKETMDTRETLANNGTGSRIAYLDARQRYSEVSADLAQRRTQLQGEIARGEELSRRFAADTARIANEAAARLSELRSQIAQHDGEIASLTAEIDTGVISAPISGTLSGLTINEAGRVVAPGEALMSIVPSDRTLIAEVRIQPKDVGFIKSEHVALIRVDGYRFGRHGGINGRIDRVSATATEDAAGNRYFTAWVKLEKDYVGEDPRANRVISGMTITADLRTGEKSLLAYLARPVRNSLDAAFSER